MNLQLSPEMIRILRAIEGAERKRAKAAEEAVRSQAHTRIHRGEKRKHIVNRVMDILSDWRFSPFEHQASCVYGLRAAMCRQGIKWLSAHNEAMALVSDALRELGAELPSWQEGQREYVIAAENCNWCGNELDPALQQGARRGRFCSVMCARSALRSRDYQVSASNSAIGRAAIGVLMQASKPVITCHHCGEPFQPFGQSNNPGHKFCSIKCYGKSKVIPPRECATCGTVFKPLERSQKFCSVSCRAKRDLPAVNCQCCGTLFVPHTEGGRYCSTLCRRWVKNLRRGLPIAAVEAGPSPKPTFIMRIAIERVENKLAA